MRLRFRNGRVLRLSQDVCRFECDIGADQQKPLLAFLSGLQGKDASAELDVWKKKRSLDSNAYAWVLIDKIAAATNQKKIDVYRQEIKEIGGNSTTVCAVTQSVETLCANWESNGDGWVTEPFESKIEGCTNVRLYYGSSRYDVAQMSALIDALIQDAKELGIETLPPDELERMMSRWKTGAS